MNKPAQKYDVLIQIPLTKEDDAELIEFLSGRGKAERARAMLRVALEMECNRSPFDY